MSLHETRTDRLLGEEVRQLQPAGAARPAETDEREVQEFRRKRLLPLYAGVACMIAGGAAAALVEFLMSGTIRLLPIVLAAVASGAATVVQGFLTGKYRVLVADEGLLVRHGRRKQMAAWIHVRAAVLLLAGKRLVLHVGQPKPISVVLGHLEKEKAAREAIESHLPSGVAMEDRRDIYGRSASAALATGFLAVPLLVIAFGLLWRAVGLWACAAGVLAAVYVYVAHVRRHAPSGGTRMWICMAWSAGALAAGVAVAAIWGALTRRSTGDVLPAMLVFAVVFGFVLIAMQLVATIRYNAALLRDVMRPPEAAPPTSG